MELKPELLLRAYAVGIFPMAESRHDQEIHWIDPDLRGILPFERFHVPRKLKRRVRSGHFEVRADSAFAQVIEACASPAPGRKDTWINPVIQGLYSELFEMGFAHSVECYREGELVGGLYGVALGAAFFGESMFSRTTDASKTALVHLVARLVKGSYVMLDTQFETPHLRQFGVEEIPRDRYRRLLAQAVRSPAQFPVDITVEELDSFLQSTS